MNSLSMVACLFAALFTIGLRAQTMESLDTEQLDEYLDQHIEQYLLRHPEVIIRSLRDFEARQKAAAEQRTAALIDELQVQLLANSTDPVDGNPDGDVSLVEFFDYNCPYCRRTATVIKQLLADDPQLRVVYKELPVLAPTSVTAAKAALAAREQGLYAALHGALMAAEGELTEAQIFRIAEHQGLAIESLRQAMQNPDYIEWFARNRELAERLQITATPTIIVGRRLMSGAVGLQELKQAIATARGGDRN